MTAASSLLELWIAAIENELIAPAAWVAWADAEIERSARPDGWILDLSMTPTKPELLPKLRAARSCSRGEPPFDHLRFALGLLFLKYERDELPIETLLLEAGDAADRADSRSLPCETFYTLLNQVEHAERRETYEPAVRALFATHADYVNQALAKIGVTPR